jgi:hypothetical protein
MDKTQDSAAANSNQSTTSNEEHDRPNLTMPYELHKTQELHCETTSSTFISKSTDDMSSEVDAPSSTGTNPNTPNYNYTMSESSNPKTVHNYFSGLNNEHHNDSCNSLSDYPTDEQTLNTLNSLNSYYRNMFGMDDTPYHRSFTGDSTLEDVSPVDLKEADTTPPSDCEEDQLDSSKVNASNDQGALNQSIHSSNDSMENNVQQKKMKMDRPNRFHILEMAKRRMGMASSSARKSSPTSSADEMDAAASGGGGGDDAASETKAPKNTPAANMAPSQDDKCNSETDSDTFLGDAIVENVAPASTSFEPNPIVGNSDESLPSYNVYASNLSQSTMTQSTNRGLQNAFVNVGGDTTVYSNAGPKSEEGSFLGGAIVENVSTPTLAAYSSSQSRPTNSDESLPSYNIHASTLSQSTKTTSTTRGLPNAFVNVGGDAYVYSSPRPLNSPINASFETAASPSTVVASGSKPRVGDSSTYSSGTTSSGNAASESVTTSSGTSESMPSTSAKDLYKSTLLAAGRPLDSRIPSTASTIVDDMILHESNLAVRNLGHASNDTSPHRKNVIQAAAITPVRRNATGSQASIESYSYNQAYENSDNVTSNPEQSLPIGSTENTFAPNLPEDYSFCPSSKHSTYSTLTDEYRTYYDVSRRTGSTAVTKDRRGNGATVIGDSAPKLQRTPSGPVDVDTTNFVSADDEESFQYDSSSVARPPRSVPSRNFNSWVFSYGSSDHLSSIIQYPSADAGDTSGRNAEGYVDEEAAMRYASLHRPRRGCLPKSLIWAAVVLLAVSLATVAFGVLWQNDDNAQTSTSLGIPVSTNGDEESSPSEHKPGHFPAFPELILPPSSPLTSSPVLPKPSAPIASIAIELSINQPSNSPSQSSPKLPIEEVVESDAPSSKPAPRPSTEETTSQPTTASPTISIQAVDESKTYTAKIIVSRDTYIRSNSSIWNYGSSDFLRVDRDPRAISVMAFDINPNNDLIQSSRQHYDALNENQSHRREQTNQLMVKVKEAKLRLYSLEDSEAGGDVYALTNAKRWDESELTWDNARDEVSASGEVFVGVIAGYIDEGLWYEVDVTSALDCCAKTVGKMNLDLLLRTDSSYGVTYASKEYASGSYAPELILTYSIETVVT